MPTSPAIVETAGVASRIGAALLDSARTDDVDLAADARRAIGDLVDRAAVHLARKTMGTALRAAFTAAAAAGASFEDMDRVRVLASSERVSTLTGQAMRTACVRFALIGMATVLASATFRSREDVRAAIDRVNLSFAPTIELAADAGDQESYRDFVALHAAVTRDLTSRSRPLPQLVRFSFGRSLPTLVVSQKLYSAADRADEIAGENKVIHPLFVPAQGRALSA